MVDAPTYEWPPLFGTSTILFARAKLIAFCTSVAFAAFTTAPGWTESQRGLKSRCDDAYPVDAGR
jgi:hypothetical protein